MKRFLPTLLLVAVLGAGFGIYQFVAHQRLAPQIAEFNRDADLLLKGLQEYRKFVGSYPSGSPAEIARALSGQSSADKKFLLVTDRKQRKNPQGEFVDPWGTPLQFYFSHNAVLIRSAGPNQAFEDSGIASSDDLYRSQSQ